MKVPIRKVAFAATLRPTPASGLASLLALSLGAFAPSGTAAAEASRDPNVMSNVIALGAGARPEYEGADHLSSVPILAARFGRGHRYLFLRGPSLSANVLDRPDLELGPLLNRDLGRDADIDSEAVAALGEIDATTELGGFVAWHPAFVGGAFGLRLEALRDAGDVHDSWRSNVAVSHSALPSARWSVETELSASIVGDDYARTYFSVDETGAALSGLERFDADGGLHDVGLGVNLRYALNRRLSLSGLLSRRQLLGDAADSPIVTEEGNAGQTFVAASLGWRF